MALKDQSPLPPGLQHVVEVPITNDTRKLCIDLISAVVPGSPDKEKLIKAISGTETSSQS